MIAPTVDLDRPRSETSRLVRSELRKVRTTSAWWWFALGLLLWTLGALGFNMWFAYQVFRDPESLGPGIEGFTSPEFHAGNIYTSGQFLGLMFVMIIGILMVTNEFHHQTATATFLTTPRRTTVILNKLFAAVLIGAVFGVATTLISLAAGSVFLQTQDMGTVLDDWTVQRAIMLNLVAYGVWTILGVAIGTLIINQLAATLIAAALYLVGTQLVGLVFFLLAEWLDNETILEWQVIVPSIASQVMTVGGEDIPGAPSWWVGALVLLGYAVAAGVAGVLITRRRDIS
jgi:ABC-type transport system involved in multi-copper enzyme maturation permease subunit